MSFDPHGKLQLRGNPDAKVVFIGNDGIGAYPLVFAVRDPMDGDEWELRCHAPNGHLWGINPCPSDVINPPVERWVPLLRDLVYGDVILSGRTFATKKEALDSAHSTAEWRTVDAIELSQYDTEEEDAT